MIDKVNEAERSVYRIFTKDGTKTVDVIRYNLHFTNENYFMLRGVFTLHKKVHM